MEKFKMGFTCMTRAVANATDNELFSDFIYNSLDRHQKGDWGDLCDDDKQANEDALQQGYRLFSKYGGSGIHVDGKQTIYIITEADRSVTTVMFPEEY